MSILILFFMAAYLVLLATGDWLIALAVFSFELGLACLVAGAVDKLNQKDRKGGGAADV